MVEPLPPTSRVLYDRKKAAGKKHNAAQRVPTKIDS